MVSHGGYLCSIFYGVLVGGYGRVMGCCKIKGVGFNGLGREESFGIFLVVIIH